jgi:glycerol uptake facilitator-like aquaporin
MVEYILLGAVAAVILLLLLLRTNTAVVFLALCAGSVLLGATGGDVGLFASSLSRGNISNDIAKIVILVLPAVVCAVLLRKRVPKSKFLFIIIPAICTALLATALVVPLLASSVRMQITATDSWQLLGQYQPTLVAIGMVASVITVALTISKPHDKDKHKKGGH